ncbi:hypothetical protein, partial [Hungatella effluvii]|uniref:hypothetical protein n=2 Tax=Hungatella effluvii TaxID=1096246 RepID=UPI002A823D6A
VFLYFVNAAAFFRIEFVEDVGVSEKKKYKTKKENKLSGGKFPETLTTRLDLDIYISLLGKYYYSFVSESIRKNNGKLTFACYPDDRFTPAESQLLMK